MEYDKPYILTKHLVVHYLVCELETECIDIPNDLLSKTTTDDGNYDIPYLNEQSYLNPYPESLNYIED